MRALLIPIPCSISDPLLLSRVLHPKTAILDHLEVKQTHIKPLNPKLSSLVLSLGFQPHTSTCLHLMICTAINAIYPPWGLIRTTLSHKSGTLRACQQLIDVQEQFPCLDTKSCKSFSLTLPELSNTERQS